MASVNLNSKMDDIANSQIPKWNYYKSGETDFMIAD